jgi:putative drug exporter of the RND superfamily
VSAFSRAAAWTIVRLRWPIVLAWAAAAVAVVVYLPSLQDAGRETSLVGLVPSEAESIATGVRSAELFDVPVVTHTHVVQRMPDGLSKPALRRVARRAERIADKRDPELAEIQFALPLVNVSRLVPSSRETNTTAITYLFFDSAETDIEDQDELTARFAAKYVHFEDDGLVGITGAVPARMQEWREIEKGLPWVTLATVLVIALILGIHFRSPVAPIVTLAAAGIAYVVSLRSVAWLGEWLDVTIPRDAEPVLVVLLLGVVTDYAVFFLHGMRERLDAGDGRLDAVHQATSEYLPIVVTAGLIVAGGTASLVAGELEFFRAFGPGMALTVLVSLAIAITLVPALMAILGERSFWPRRPSRDRAPAGPSRFAYLATARPVAFAIAIVAGVALVVACKGLLDTNLGITQIQGLPKSSEQRRAQDAAALGFAPGILSPTVLLLEGVGKPSDLPSLVRLQKALERESGIATTIGPDNAAAREIPGLVLAEDAVAARYLVILDDEPQGGPAGDTVQRLRERLPTLTEKAGLTDVEVRLAGDTALAEETIDTIARDLVRIGIAAFLVNFLLLAIFLRALIAPLYLVLASVLALAASLGLTTLFFQGFLGHDEITYHVPFAVAVLLLSLGSDYNVFVVGRIWQCAEEEQVPLREAIATAAPRASRAIGVAGLALAFSFAALALIDLRQFREFAFAMCVGVLLDAFLVRAVLIPALISLFGERSFWPRTRPPRKRRPAAELGPA